MTLHPHAPEVPGYRLGRHLGAGSSGQVWAATGSDGREVAVKLVAAGDAATREVAALQAVDNPHVVPLLDAIALDDGRLALVSPLLDGGTLGEVVAARGRLRAGEVVTVIAPLAQAIDALHAQGMEHGDLAPGNVLLDGDGRPWLADLGTVRITGEPREEEFGTAGYVDPVVLIGGTTTSASDVYGLGALAWFALCGEPPAPSAWRPALTDVLAGVSAQVAAAVERAVDPDPAGRPTPLELARSLHDAAVAVPVWRPGLAPSAGGLTHRFAGARAQEPARVGQHRRPRRSRVGWRAVGIGAGVATGLVLTGLVAVIALPAPAATIALPAPAATSAPGGERADLRTPAQALEVLTVLAAQRARRFSDPGRFAALAGQRGPAAAADRVALGALASRGLHYRGLRLTPRSATLVRSGPGSAVVDAVVDVSAYEVVDGSGVVLQRVAAVSGQRSRLTLVRAGGGWQVRAVSPA